MNPRGFVIWPGGSTPPRLRVSLTCIEALEGGGGVLTLGVLGVLARRHRPGGKLPQGRKPPPKQGALERELAFWHTHTGGGLNWPGGLETFYRVLGILEKLS
jgi:hypothetical protein